MQENNQQYHGFVSPDSYRTIYITMYILYFIICCFFLIWAIIIKEIAILILSAIFILVGVFAVVYNLLLFSKYYIEKQKITIKIGNLHIKEMPLDNSKIRRTELYSRNARKWLISQDKYLIIAKQNVDIDSVLHYTEKELLKVLKTKDVIAIPETAMEALYKETRDGSLVPSQ